MKVQVHDFPPYSYIENGVWQGSRVVLSQRLAEKLNCNLEYLNVPFGRALMLMNEGKLDFIFNLTKTSDRQKTMLFIAAHHLEVLVLGVPSANPQWLQLNSVAEIQHFPGHIALTTGSYLGPVLEKMRVDPIFATKFIEVADRRAKNELVLKGRAQAVIEDRDYLKYAIENFSHYQHLVINPLILSESAVYMALSRKSPLYQRHDDIVQAVLELQKNQLWPSIPD